MDQVKGSDQSVFERKCKGSVVKLKAGIKFHLYISRAPCGDASMEALAIEKGDEESRETSTCVESQVLRGRLGFKALGMGRTKPGRHDAETTECMSCSDKIAMWNVIGFQGSLLDQFTGPLFLDSIVIGAHYHEQGLERALWERIKDISIEAPYGPRRVHFIQSKHGFVADRVSMTGFLRAANTSMCYVKGRAIEYYNDGLKEGALKKFSPKFRYFGIESRV